MLALGAAKQRNVLEKETFKLATTGMFSYSLILLVDSLM